MEMDDWDRDMTPYETIILCRVCGSVSSDVEQTTEAQQVSYGCESLAMPNIDEP